MSTEAKHSEEVSRLFTMLRNGTSAPMAVKEAARQLREAGFEELEFKNVWGLTYGGKYYMKHHDTALFAFTIGENMQFNDTFRIAAAHTDYPCLRIKPNPDMRTLSYDQLNVEVYGGPILNTWLDRPLGISGRVAVRSRDVMHPDMRYIDIRRPLMVIPNLAIHLNREVNKGVELNRQTDLLPIIGTGEKEGAAGESFLVYLAEELGVSKEEILDYELWVTCLEQPGLVGIREDLAVSPRLDNLTSVQALVSGIIQGERDRGINLIALFDHEETGNRGKQGAASSMLPNLLEKICECFSWSSTQIRDAVDDSMMLSVDVAQGTHPNYVGKMDPTNRPVLNGGFCIKEACNQTYVTDCRAVAVIEQICRERKIPYQKFVNRSDVLGGSTLGAAASSILPVSTVDIGIPILAMHSAVETMGVKDQIAMTDLVAAFFQI